LFLVIYVAVLFDTGSPLFRQKRVGLNQKPFTLLKFRTMPADTVSIASHLIDPSIFTPVGAFLRRTKLDEIPQFWNVLKGEMSLVGPRPCLLNQTEVIRERAIRAVFSAKPGITGLAQIKRIDMSTPQELAEADARMIRELTVLTYLNYILKTITGVKSSDRLKNG